MRDTNRTTQLRLRDIEVSNDDFERQARHTTSSLEDLESKYNQAIERGVLAEEEIRAGEQEREGLRIESQRLRDELNDLKIEAEIRQDKLRNAEAAVDLYSKRRPAALDSSSQRPTSALSETSPTTSVSSPTIATPPTKSESSNVSDTQTPPSPPTSDKSGPANNITPMPTLKKTRMSITDANTTPRPSLLPSRVSRISGRPSFSASGQPTPLQPTHQHRSQTSLSQSRPGLPQSGSLHHLHGLMNKMQKLEQRVQSARSKLPAPTTTPPRASPRSGSSLGQSYVPSNITVRSNRKRTGGSNVSASQTPNTDRPSSRLSSTFTPNPDQANKRVSIGFQHGSPLREAHVRPPSREMHSSRPPSRDPVNTRPSSRASLSTRQSISHLPSAGTSRPGSRQSITGSRTPMGHYPSSSQSEARRPRSSFGGSYRATHGHSASVSRLSNYGAHFQAEEEESAEMLTPTPSRRTTLAKDDDQPSAFSKSTLGLTPKKSISAFSSAMGRRISSGGGGDMGPPDRKLPTRRLSGVGETY